MVRTGDIHSVTDFTRNSKKYIDQICETKNPIALTVNGHAQVVVVDAEAYQKLVDEAEHERLMRSLREGEEDIKNGRVQKIEVAFAEMREKLGF